MTEHPTPHRCAHCGELAAGRDAMEAERDQALYERDVAMRLWELALESIEFARGMIPTQPGDTNG